MSLLSDRSSRRTEAVGSICVVDQDESTGCFTVCRLARSPRAAAAGAAMVGLAVYGSTMYPGLAGIGDTPKFQFVGSVLGTPHSPGYPLYMLLSWAVTHLPAGTLAFRMNVMSVAFGAAAVGGFTLVLVELGCAPVVAAAGALSIAFGRVLWSQALLAEVYTLTDRATLAPRILVRAGAIVCAGLSLCGLIWLRTVQHAPYLEVRFEFRRSRQRCHRTAIPRLSEFLLRR